MISNLAKELSRFSRENRHLRKLLENTTECFHDINSVKFASGVQPLKAELSDEEEKEIQEATEACPSLCIGGRSNSAKAFVVNELLDTPILPCDLNAKQQMDELRWRRVDFVYGENTYTSLCVPGSFELLQDTDPSRHSVKTISLSDLQLSDTDGNSADKWTIALEVQFNHSILLEGGHITVIPQHEEGEELVETYRVALNKVVPIMIYCIARNTLSTQELSDLRFLREAFPDLAVFFVKVPTFDHPLPHNPAPSPNLGSVREALIRNNINQDFSLQNMFCCDGTSEKFYDKSSVSFGLFQQLLDLGYLSLLPNSPSSDSGSGASNLGIADSDSGYYAVVDSELVENFDSFGNLVSFARQILQKQLVHTVNLLNVVHIRCVQHFILKAFDMARDMMITPKRLEFARAKETALYDSLMEIAVKKQEEIKKIIQETISAMKEDLIIRAEEYHFVGVEWGQTEGVVRCSSDLKSCTAQIQEVVLGSLNSAIASRLLSSVDILRDSYTGVLTRCLESLEQSDAHNLESTRTSLALREILTAAYQVEITVRSGTSIVKVLLEKMKQLLHSLPWHSTPRIDKAWKRQVASDMLNGLSEARLAKSICGQIKERLRHSHDTFSSALKQLETRHSGRLEKTEEHRIKVRKVYAPRVARLALESTSMRDYILCGMPQMGREVGRGQYGVVYSCDKWGSFGPCAIKSVVPPDDKHWNDLALEFYYTKHVPHHPHIVSLCGSVIDYSYGGGSSPAVLLIMDRLQRDLYAAIKAGLDWLPRLQVAIDVVEGIRFLHSQGLVHRDIKLKNVLLNEKNRGLLTDLGFCKPEAMMSGSIVGTPIHMAPELFSGKYDNSVDVYAFGVLFWYVCSGQVRLPRAFEQCSNKEMLWTSVRRGIRPEHLPQFDPECWQLMQSCWHGDPLQRPLLGNVQPQLIRIYERFNPDIDSGAFSCSVSSSGAVNTHWKSSAARRKTPTVRRTPVS